MTKRQKDRSASSTIKGYLYQFERSVVEVLNLQDGEEAVIEGVEDIDLWSTAPETIQIKYYEAQKWSLKSLKKVIIEMLNSFNAGLKIKYILYVHYGEGGDPPSCLTVAEIKEALTYKPHDEPTRYLYLDYDTELLEEFSQKFEIRVGPSLEAQREATLMKLCETLKCSLDEAEVLHRMRAVQFLHDKAIDKDELKRTVTKTELVGALNIRDILYHRWHKETVNYDSFIDAAVRQLKRLEFNNPNINRGAIVEVTGDNIDGVCGLAVELANDLNGVDKRRTTNAKPWTLALRGSEDLIRSVKERLITDNIFYNDGYEDVYPSSEAFSSPPVVNSSPRATRLRKASYPLRLASEASLQKFSENNVFLKQLIILFPPSSWHSKVAEKPNTVMTGLSVNELTMILRRVTT